MWKGVGAKGIMRERKVLWVLSPLRALVLSSVSKAGILENTESKSMPGVVLALFNC